MPDLHDIALTHKEPKRLTEKRVREIAREEILKREGELYKEDRKFMPKLHRCKE